MSDNLSNFLAHHGIKGMKWGVRRSDAQLARTKGGSKDGEDTSSNSVSRSDAKKAAAGKDVFISADAERFIKTRMKEGHEMSDREMREAINRANMAKQYDELFGPNASLKSKVEQLKLQKEYSQLNSELHPSRLAKVKDLVSAAQTGWEAYQKLDAATGHYLSKEMRTAFTVGATGHTPKHKK